MHTGHKLPQDVDEEKHIGSRTLYSNKASNSQTEGGWWWWMSKSIWQLPVFMIIWLTWEQKFQGLFTIILKLVVLIVNLEKALKEYSRRCCEQVKSRFET